MGDGYNVGPRRAHGRQLHRLYPGKLRPANRTKAALTALREDLEVGQGLSSHFSLVGLVKTAH